MVFSALFGSPLTGGGVRTGNKCLIDQVAVHLHRLAHHIVKGNRFDSRTAGLVRDLVVLGVRIYGTKTMSPSGVSMFRPDSVLDTTVPFASGTVSSNATAIPSLTPTS